MALAALVVGLSKGGLPTVGMLGVPLLSLVMSPLQAAVWLLPIYVASDAVAVWLWRRQYSAPNLRLLIPAGVAGVGLGWVTAAWVSDAAVGLMIGVLGVAFCLHQWWPRRVAPQARPIAPARGVLWGVVAGFTSFISHAGAPPFQVFVLPQRLPKAVYAGTATWFFAVINAVKIVPYQVLRPYTLAALADIAPLVPVALAGALLGRWLTHRIPERWFFRVVQVGLMLVSLRLIAQSWP